MNVTEFGAIWYNGLRSLPRLQVAAWCWLDDMQLFMLGVEVQVAIVDTREEGQTPPAGAIQALTPAGRSTAQACRAYGTCLRLASCTYAGLWRCKRVIMCAIVLCSRSVWSRLRCLRTSDFCRCEAGALAICCRQIASDSVVLAAAIPPSSQWSPSSQVCTTLNFGCCIC